MDSVWHLAFILHRSLYRDASLKLTLFTKEQGKITVVAYGVQRRKAPWFSLLQPFIPLNVLYRKPRQGFLRLEAVERAPSHCVFDRVFDPNAHPEALFQGFYINELLFRILPEEEDRAEHLFEVYCQVLGNLIDKSGQSESNLRLFEWTLLNTLGYGFSLTHEAGHRCPILAERYYHFKSQCGFVPVAEHGSLLASERGPVVFPGQTILAMSRHAFQEPSVRLAAKQLTRLALAPFLGPKPLYSRALYRYYLKNSLKHSLKHSLKAADGHAAEKEE